jgi:hypothetical protein
VTNPRHALETDNGRYYNIPGIEKPLVSVTNAISVGLAKYGLPLWYANMATEAAWEVVPQMGAALRVPDCGHSIKAYAEGGPAPCDRCRACLTRHIKQAAEVKRDSAAFLGTRVHELAEAHLLGKQMAEQEGDREAGLYVVQYLKFLKDFDVDPTRDVVATEATVCYPSLGYAGTGDIWLRLPFDGFLFDGAKLQVKPVTDPAERATILIDIKTSRTRAATQTYPENLMQLAALKHAKHIVLPDDTLAPNIPVRGAATLQLREKSYALIPVPCTQREFALFQNVLALADWLHHTWPGNYDFRPLLPSGKVKPKRNTKKEEA